MNDSSLRASYLGNRTQHCLLPHVYSDSMLVVLAGGFLASLSLGGWRMITWWLVLGGSN